MHPRLYCFCQGQFRVFHVFAQELLPLSAYRINFERSKSCRKKIKEPLIFTNKSLDDPPINPANTRPRPAQSSMKTGIEISESRVKKSIATHQSRKEGTPSREGFARSSIFNNGLHITFCNDFQTYACLSNPRRPKLIPQTSRKNNLKITTNI